MLLKMSNKETLRKFLIAIDDTATKHHFTASRNSTDIKVYYDTLDSVYHKLLNANNEGYDIYVTINKFTSRGRKVEDVKAIRGLFIDEDTPLKREFPLEPTILVETSRNHYHHWIMLDEPLEPTDDNIQWYRDSARALHLLYGSDKGSTKLIQACRAPTFINHKHDREVKLLEIHDNYYSKDELSEHLQHEDIKAFKKRNKASTKRVSNTDIRRLKSALESVCPDDYDTWVNVGMALHAADLKELWVDWCIDGGWDNEHDENQREIKWRSFGNYSGPIKTINSIFKTARENGWKDLKGSRIKIKRRNEETEDDTEKKENKVEGLQNLSEVDPKITRWLSEQLIPLGGVTMLAGAKGSNKSTLAGYIAAQVTKGLPIFEGDTPVDGNVLILCEEENTYDTIVPRLKAYKADMTKVWKLNFVELDDDETEFFSIEDHIEYLHEIIVNNNIILTMFDTLGGYVGSNVSRKGYEDLSKIVSNLNNVAAETNSAVLALTHFAKTNEGNKTSAQIEKVMGSYAYVGVSRSVIALAPDKEVENLRHLLPLAINRRAKRDPIDFDIISHEYKVGDETDTIAICDNFRVSDTDENTAFGGTGGAMSKHHDAKETLLALIREHNDGIRWHRVEKTIQQHHSHYGKRTVDGARAALVKDGLIRSRIVRDETGNKTYWYPVRKR